MAYWQVKATIGFGVAVPLVWRGQQLSVNRHSSFRSCSVFACRLRRDTSGHHWPPFLVPLGCSVRKAAWTVWAQRVSRPPGAHPYRHLK